MWFCIDNSRPVEVTQVGRIRYISNWNLRGKRSTCDRIIFVLEGQIHYTIDEREYTVSKGEYVFIPNGAFYSSYIKDSCEFYFIHFVPCHIQPLSDEECTARKEERRQLYRDRPALGFGHFHPCTDYNIYLRDSAATGEQFSSIILMLGKCESCCYVQTPENKMLVNLRVQRLLLALAESTDTQERADTVPSVLLKMTTFIQQNYTTDITLTTLSEQFALSKQYIIRLFKKYMGTTVTKYINLMRLERSLELLRHSSLNVSEISAFLGYHSVYYFCRLFKATYHITPTCYIQGKGDIDYD